MTGNDSFTATTISSTGTLAVDSAVGLGPVSFTGAGTVQALDDMTLADIATGAAATLDCNGCTLTIAGALSGSGGLSAIDSSGSGTMLLTADNSGFAGTLTIASGATLEAESPAALPGNATAESGAVLAANVTDGGWQAADIASLLGSNDFAAGASLGFDTGSSANFTYPGNIADTSSGPLGVVVYGGGTLTLTGNNTYSGNTVVNNSLSDADGYHDMLNLNGTLQNSNVVIESGVLVLGGTVDQNVTMSGGGVDDAGSSTSPAILGSVTVTGGTANWYSLYTTVAGGVTINDNATFIVGNGAALPGTNVLVNGVNAVVQCLGNAQIGGDVDLNGGTVYLDPNASIAGKLNVTGWVSGVPSSPNIDSYWTGSGIVQGAVTVGYGGTCHVGTADVPATLNANGGVLITGSGQLAADNANSAIYGTVEDEGWRTW